MILYCKIIKLVCVTHKFSLHVAYKIDEFYSIVLRKTRVTWIMVYSLLAVWMYGMGCCVLGYYSNWCCNWTILHVLKDGQKVNFRLYMPNRVSVSKSNSDRYLQYLRVRQVFFLWKKSKLSVLHHWI